MDKIKNKINKNKNNWRPASANDERWNNYDCIVWMNVKIINVKKEWHNASKTFKNNCHSFLLKKALACTVFIWITNKWTCHNRNGRIPWQPYIHHVRLRIIHSILRTHSIQHICPYHRMLFPSLPPPLPSHVLFLPSHSFKERQVPKFSLSGSECFLANLWGLGTK